MELKKLNLSIPSMDSDDCKSLMGGDGYGADRVLDEVIVVAPERPDVDVDRDPIDDDPRDDDDDRHEDPDRNDDNGNYDGQDGNQGNQFDPSKMGSSAQIGNCCSFAAIYAVLCGYGQQSDLSWMSVAMKFAEMNGMQWTEVVGPDWNGANPDQLNALINEYFNSTQIGNSAEELSDALKDGGPVIGVVNPGDVDNNGIEDDGHAVVIIDYDPESGTITYWDPETGSQQTGSIDDFMGGWDINGLR